MRSFRDVVKNVVMELFAVMHGLLTVVYVVAVIAANIAVAPLSQIAMALLLWERFAFTREGVYFEDEAITSHGGRVMRWTDTRLVEGPYTKFISKGSIGQLFLLCDEDAIEVVSTITTMFYIGIVVLKLYGVCTLSWALVSAPFWSCLAAVAVEIVVTSIFAAVKKRKTAMSL